MALFTQAIFETRILETLELLFKAGQPGQALLNLMKLGLGFQNGPSSLLKVPPHICRAPVQGFIRSNEAVEEYREILRAFAEL